MITLWLSCRFGTQLARRGSGPFQKLIIGMQMGASLFTILQGRPVWIAWSNRLNNSYNILVYKAILNSLKLFRIKTNQNPNSANRIIIKCKDTLPETITPKASLGAWTSKGSLQNVNQESKTRLRSSPRITKSTASYSQAWLLREASKTLS